MKISKEKLLELEVILREDYDCCLDKSELEKFASNLVGLFDLLIKVETRTQNGNS